MRTDDTIARRYQRALAVRQRVTVFQAELVQGSGWDLVARLMGGRFDQAFIWFLDAPSEGNLSRLLGFDADMREIAAKLPAVRANTKSWRRPT